MEKHIHKNLHENKIGFKELSVIAENILPANIGSNEFHRELEDFLLKKFSSENL